MHKALNFVYQSAELRSFTAFTRKFSRFLLKKLCFLCRVIYILVIIVQTQELAQLKPLRLLHKLRMTFSRNENFVNRSAFVI